MASELVPQVMCVHNSKERSFECAEGCCGQMRWSTVRQGSIWINGLFCDQEGVMNDANHVDSLFDPESRKTKHLEEDVGSADMIHQGLICGESPPSCSLFRGQVDTAANEEVEKLIDVKMEIQRESVLNNHGECETVTSMDTCGTSSKNNVLEQTTCNGGCPTNGVSKLCLRHQRCRCYAAHDNDILEGTCPTGCMSVPPADDLTRKVPRACQEYSSADDCNRSILAKEKWVKVFNTPQRDQVIIERSRICSEAENGVLSRCDEEQRDGKDVDITYKHAMYLELNPAADSSDFLREGEVRVSGKGAMLPLIIEADNHSTEATTKEEGSVSCSIRGESQSVECSIQGENQSAEAENAESLSGGCRDDGFSSNGDRPKSGTLPEEALLYALPYMSLKDVLSMERVSKIFREWVKNDVLLWQQLHIEPPLSKKLTDEALLELASRSKGQLQSLSLVDCLRITEDAVEQVVYSNTRLSKLCIPGCSRITPEAVLRMVKTHSDHRFPGMPGLKQLRLRNIYGLTKDHLDVLLTMLDDGKQAQPITKKHQFYQNGHHSPSCDDQRPIDVEACPKCSNVRLVYDCTRERCQGNIFQECRACSLCIVRCAECGKCIDDNDFEETFCLDVLCSSCWLWLPKCSECNRPSCGRHAGGFIQTSETSFVCSDCLASPGAVDPEFHVYAGSDI